MGGSAYEHSHPLIYSRLNYPPWNIYIIKLWFWVFGGGRLGVEFAINYLPPLISTFYYFLETRSINELEAQRFRLARQ